MRIPKILIILALLSLALAPLVGTYLIDHLTRISSIQMQLNALKRQDRPVIIVHAHSGAIVELVATHEDIILSGVTE